MELRRPQPLRSHSFRGFKNELDLQYFVLPSMKNCSERSNSNSQCERIILAYSWIPLLPCPWVHEGNIVDGLTLNKLQGVEFWMRERKSLLPNRISNELSLAWWGGCRVTWSAESHPVQSSCLPAQTCRTLFGLRLAKKVTFPRLGWSDKCLGRGRKRHSLCLAMRPNRVHCSKCSFVWQWMIHFWLAELFVQKRR